MSTSDDTTPLDERPLSWDWQWDEDGAVCGDWRVVKRSVTRFNAARVPEESEEWLLWLRGQELPGQVPAATALLAQQRAERIQEIVDRRPEETP